MRVSPILYFDLETQLSAADVGGLENAQDMRVSVACAFDSAEWHYYTEETIGDLVHKIRIAALVIGFNIKNFEYKVLSRYTQLDFDTIPTFDMLDEIYQQLGHRVSLDNLAQATLDMEKVRRRWHRHHQFVAGGQGRGAPRILSAECGNHAKVVPRRVAGWIRTLHEGKTGDGD